MVTLEDAVGLAAADNGLAFVATLRADNSIQSSLINAGALAHPASGESVLGFVTYGKVKLVNLRGSAAARRFRTGWQWATVEGTAELVGPDDPQPWLTDPDRLRLLLREVFSAAGGTHDDWDTYDQAMAEQRRTVVLVRPRRIYRNG